MIKKISENLTNKILTIGPDYVNNRGGIGAVIELYEKYFETFNFIPTYRTTSSFKNLIIYVFSIFKLFLTLIFNRKIEIVHIHGASNGSFLRKYFLFLIAKYLFTKKIIYHIHGGGFANFYSICNKFKKALIAHFINKSDVIFCLSKSWETFYKSTFKQTNIQVIPNIIDYPLNLSSKRNNTKITLLFLGLISNSKGIFDLVSVISKNKLKYNEKLTLIIGGIGEQNKLKNLIDSNEISHIIKYNGWIDKQMKNKYLSECDLYILPSYQEGLPISILEAMSYGKAIIASNVGGIPEIVIPNNNGILIEPGNLSQIEQAIDFYIASSNHIFLHGVESKKIIEDYFPNNVLLLLSKNYTNLLSNKINSLT
ncbi:MAG: glycosyltransferase family 4 protein [Bacteroidales bacterium]|nr:glycosyltransferase family 4 protein [Bacteroidales bacterium]